MAKLRWKEKSLALVRLFDLKQMKLEIMCYYVIHVIGCLIIYVCLYLYLLYVLNVCLFLYLQLFMGIRAKLW